VRSRQGRDAAPLRDWQVRALALMESWEGGPFLLSAAPGAGKTRPALVLAASLLERRLIDRVVVVCPTTPLTRQWAEAATALGIQLEPDAAELRPTRDFHGVAVTYARVGMAAAAYRRQCTPRTLIVADEAHHLGEELSWGQAFNTAFEPSERWLLLSGTPFRSDQSPIPGVRYDDDGVAVADFTYSYAEAIRDRICRPVTFVAYDGTLRWQSGDDVLEASFDEVLSGREASRRYRTAISTELPDGLPRILREAHERLLAVRESGHADAGGLVVAADGTHARAIAALLADVTGEKPTVVLHTEARAAQKLARFRESRQRWIVAVNMVSEGVDIPRLRVGVYATAAKTPLIFRQIVGRFVRTSGAATDERSWVFLPGDPILRGLAGAVEEELRHVLRPPAEADEFADQLDEVPTKREDEQLEAPAWVPVSAEVAPQMTLFAGPAMDDPVTIQPRSAPVPAPASTALPAAPPPLPRVPPPVGADADADGEAPAKPAYVRRRELRAERHGLVSELARMTGRSHREINGDVNRACGVKKVDDATVEQLERSKRFLLDQLTKASRRRTARR
jgi:superfamily II DNA or RNA helicase